MLTQLSKIKKKKGKVYFTPDTEAAVLEYIAEPDVLKRSIIYKDRIEFALDKMAESIINTKKFSYINESFYDIKHELVAHILLNISKISPEKGRAFSYFTRSMINYLILWNRRCERRMKNEMSMSGNDDSENSFALDIKDESYDIDEKNDDISTFIQQFIIYLKENSYEICKGRKKYQNILSAIIHLLENKGMDIISKKSIFVYIREMTDDTSQNINRILNVMKKIYLNAYSSYKEHGYLDMSKKYYN
jgi:hypothetical protein